MDPLSPISELVFEACTEVPVAATDGHIRQPHPIVTFNVWSEAKKDLAKEGLDGSTEPIALMIPKKSVPTYTIKLRATGKCLFPPFYTRTTDCKLVGTLRNAPGSSSITSKVWKVILNGDPKVAESLDFDFQDFVVTAPFSNKICLIPFRLAGDFEWSIVDVSVLSTPSMPPLIYTTAVRLELIWLLETPTAGPLLIQTPLMRTATDFLGSYPVGLLRLFLPAPVDFKSDSSFGINYQSWWISWAASRLYNKGLVYDTFSGKSGFGVGCCGGSFDMDQFQQLCDSPNAASLLAPNRINSFDLSALMQLACGLLISSDGCERLNTVRTCATPYGNLKAGIPFGLSAKSSPAITARGVNNPYFQSKDGATAFEANATNREGCKVKSWIEADIQLIGKGRVVDLSWSVPPRKPEMELGAKDRDTFIAAHIEGPPLSFIEHEDADSSDGQLYRNNGFGEKQSGSLNNIARVGVYDLRGINECRPNSNAPLIPVPNTLRKSIDTLLVLGKNPKNSFWGYNDASLQAMNVESILRESIPSLQFESNLPHDQTSYRVALGTTRVSYRFSGMPITSKPPELGNLEVNVNIFDNLHDSYEAFVFELTKYERDVSNFVTAVNLPNPASHIGHYSLQTPHSILCIRGNLFIEMTIRGNSRPSVSDLALVADTMRNLDSYLSQRTVSKSQVRRPRISLTTPHVTVLPDKALFTVTLVKDDMLGQVVFAKTDRGDLIVPASFAENTSTYTFWMLQKDAKWKAKTVITISGAHFDTFHPGSTSITADIESA